MTQPLPEVFTVAELTRAVGVSREVGDAMVEAKAIRLVPGTSLVAWADAVSSAPLLRAAARERAPEAVRAPLFSNQPAGAARRDRSRLPATASVFVHATVLALTLWHTTAPARVGDDRIAPAPVRLVFLMTPGPGGGGGGGGASQPLAARRFQSKGPPPNRLNVPEVRPEPLRAAPRPEEQPPLASTRIIAPVAPAAASPHDRDGLVDDTSADLESEGPGAAGGAGTGRGPGNGAGLGAGIGDGDGGGIGGGPYRPGSGIEPPRLLREVKASYTDEARRRGVIGDVILEIVVRRDGSVGGVSIMKGLGAGLDQRAVAAVREWRFEPARRKGEAVDVIVEVAVEFSLR